MRSFGFAIGVINKLVTIDFCVGMDRGGVIIGSRRLERGHNGQWVGYLCPEADNPLDKKDNNDTRWRLCPAFPKVFMLPIVLTYQ